MNKKKLLIFSDCYIYGGSERLMGFLLSNDLLNEQYNLSFAFRNHKDYVKGLEGDLQKWKINANIYPLRLLSNATFFHHLSCSTLSPIIQKVIKAPFYLLEKVGLYFIFNVLSILLFLISNRPTIVHINNGGYPGASSCNHFVLCCRVLGIRALVYQVNNMAYPPKYFFSKYYDRLIGRLVNYFITASAEARLALTNIRNFDKDKIVQIPNTVKIESGSASREDILKEAAWAANTFLLVEVAFLTSRKGQIYLLEALKEIIEEDPGGISEKIKVMLVGNGEDEAKLKDYVQTNNLDTHVFFAGYRPNSVDFINASDVFVLPSVANEDMPLAMLAAMSMERAIISSGFAGILEAIHHEENGLLISKSKEEIVAQLKAAITFLFKHPELRIEYGKNAGITFKEKFSEEAYGKKIARLYEQCLAK